MVKKHVLYVLKVLISSNIYSSYILFSKTGWILKLNKWKKKGRPAMKFILK